MTLRKRCLVLRQIEHFQGKATLDLVHSALPEFSKDDIQKAIYNLLQQDRIFKGDEKVIGKSGRPQFNYLVNNEWGSAKQESMPGKRLHAKGRKAFTGKDGELATNSTKALVRGVIKFRDRKIKLLCQIVDGMTSCPNRDLLIGLLAHLGHTYEPKAHFSQASNG